VGCGSAWTCGRIRVLVSCLTLKLTRARPSRLREVSDGDQTCVTVHVCMSPHSTIMTLISCRDTHSCAVLLGEN